MKRIIITLIMSVFLLTGLRSEAKNQALLIGIGNYNTTTTGWPVISGNQDIDLLKPKLEAHGFTVTSLTDNQATKKNVVSTIKKLISSTSKGDNVYLHFSGHGQLVEDVNNDEAEDFDQSFICYDACFSPSFKGYKGQNHLIDDELFPLINQLKAQVGATGLVTVIFDSCYSGGADRGEYEDDPDPDSEVEWTEFTRGTGDEFQVNKNATSYLRSIKKPGEYTKGGGLVTVISACQPDKRNFECRDRRSGKHYGSLSFCISKMLDANIPMNQWYEYFANKTFRKLKVFRPSQHPVAERHN